MILSGKELSKSKKEDFKSSVDDLKEKTGRAPSLHVVLVGEDPASKVYVGHKEKLCQTVGVTSVIHRLESTTQASELKGLIERLNKDEDVDGILVQLPMPPSLSGFDPLKFIDPKKDVDGLSSLNMGLMIKNEAYAEPCTPKGIIELLKANEIKLEGTKAAVIGRSEIVGWPMAWMLTRENATVTVCHSKTRNIDEILKNSDLVVAAAGRPHFVNQNMLKDGAVVVDVGIHRTEAGKLIGDVNPEGFAERNISHSPVPGGVGPMTVSTLVDNLIGLYKIKIKNADH